MSAVTRLTPPAVSAYAPGAGTHLSEVTVAAIDTTGNATADAMEKAANAIEAAAGKLAGEIMAEAKETASDMRKKASEQRERARKMSQAVSDYCLWNQTTRATIRSIPFDVADKVEPASRDDGEPSPAFLHRAQD